MKLKNRLRYILSLFFQTGGKKNGYRTHNLLLNPKESAERTLVIIEDYNPKELIEKKILSAVAVPLRIKGKDATPINIIANVE